MKVLGFDTATVTGWSFYDSKKDKILEYGHEDFKKVFPKGAIPRSALFLKFDAFVERLFNQIEDEYGIDFVVYEVPHFRGGQTIKLVGLAVLIEMQAEKRGICFDGVHSGTLKKSITGGGKADKKRVMKCISDRVCIPLSKITNDEADSMAACLWAAVEYGKQPGMRKIKKRRKSRNEKANKKDRKRSKTIESKKAKVRARKIVIRKKPSL